MVIIRWQRSNGMSAVEIKGSGARVRLFFLRRDFGELKKSRTEDLYKDIKKKSLRDCVNNKCH